MRHRNFHAQDVHKST